MSLFPSRLKKAFFSISDSFSDIRVASGIAIGAQAIKACIQLFGLVLLARLISPIEYGYGAALLAIAGFMLLFRDVGMVVHIQSATTLTREEISDSAIIGLAVAFLVALACYVSAPAIAAGVSMPVLESSVRICAMLVPLAVIQSLASAVLRRNLRNNVVVASETLSLLLSVGLALVVASKGGGHLAILVQIIALNVFGAILIYWISGGFGITSWRGTWGGAGALRVAVPQFFYGLLVYGMRNADNLIVARFFGAAVLGPYSRAYSVVNLPLGQLVAPITPLAVPILSRSRSDPEKFRQTYRALSSAVAALTFPLGVFLFRNAEQVVATVLGSQWSAAVPIFKVMSVCVVVHPLCATVGWVVAAERRTGSMLTWALFHSLLLFGPLLIAANFSFQYFLWTYVVCSSFLALVSPFVLLGRAPTSSPIDFVKASVPGVLSLSGYWLALIALDIHQRDLRCLVEFVVMGAIATPVALWQVGKAAN